MYNGVVLCFNFYRLILYHFVSHLELIFFLNAQLRHSGGRAVLNRWRILSPGDKRLFILLWENWGKKGINKLCVKETISLKDMEEITEIKIVDLAILKSLGGRGIPIRGTALASRGNGKKVWQWLMTD